MCQQITDGNVFFSILTEFRNVFHNWIVQPYFPLLHQLHDGRCGRDYFRERRQVENRVYRHWPSDGFEGALAECLAIDHMTVVPDKKHRPRNVVVVDRGFDDGVKTGQTG